jgi:predicted nuclease of predicted toxin-antitoxin system
LLRAHGWDVVHVGEIGFATATDAQILAFALRERRACVTLDADFHTLLAVGGARAPSVIRIRREGLNGQALTSLLQQIWVKIALAVQQGAMITVTEKAVRIHRLPVRM